MLFVGIGNVKRFLVRRECESVGARQVLDHHLQFAAGIPEDAVEFQFLRVVVILLQQPVRRVREVERSVGLIHQVVGAVEALALVLLQI